MYGPDYADVVPMDSIDDPKTPERVLAFLQKRRPGVFVDFGCGTGSLLLRAAALGWTPIGVEYDDAVAGETSARTGCRVFAGLSALKASALAIDVVNLGDVIEHLPAPFKAVQELAGVLQPGGWLMAQGPLEAGPCVFSIALHAVAQLRGGRVTRMPPYHVLRATVLGQWTFFSRLGLKELTYEVSEAAWPAPSRISAALHAGPRMAGLFFLRRASQAVSALNPTAWGNRYFYVGERRAEATP